MTLPEDVCERRMPSFIWRELRERREVVRDDRMRVSPGRLHVRLESVH